MKNKGNAHAGLVICATAGAALYVASQSVAAQQPPSAPTASVAPDPNPYYLGVGQGFTHDSNVYRVPSGPGDIYSSTSVFGGFDQPISRQRVFGRANVSFNRYQDESQLNNTSYDVGLGAALATIENISGNLDLGFTNRLAAPAATVGVPNAIRNQEQTQRIDASARWGGPSLLTLEGSVGYLRVDYSAPEYVSSESRKQSASLGLYYRPGEFLRVGLAGRFDRAKTPQAFLDPTSGTYVSNTIDGRNVDLIVDYTHSQLLQTHARFSYTNQRNTSVDEAFFSGFTGSLFVAWQPTAKISVQMDASREAGLDASPHGGYAAVQSGTGLTLTPVTVLFQNNRLTSQFGLGTSYAATAKINAAARLRYSRARLLTTQSTLAAATADTTDVVKSASLGATYEINRAWNLGCDLGYEKRDVGGGVFSYAYSATTIGCVTRFVWR